MFYVKVPSLIKYNKYNLLTGLKKTENINRKNTRKKQKILHNLERTPDEILKVRGKKFSWMLWVFTKRKITKSPWEDASSREIEGL